MFVGTPVSSSSFFLLFTWWGLQILKRCYGFPFLIEEVGVRLVKEAVREGVLLRVESKSEEETTFNNSPHVSNVNTSF